MSRSCFDKALSCTVDHSLIDWVTLSWGCAFVGRGVERTGYCCCGGVLSVRVPFDGGVEARGALVESTQLAHTADPGQQAGGVDNVELVTAGCAQV